MRTDEALSKTRRPVLGGALLLLALSLGAAALAQSGGREYTVGINNMSYDPTPSNLKVGDTIAWVNRDTVLHSVTARDHSFDLRINPGQTVKQSLTKAGNFPFICLFHTTMRGALVVGGK